MKRRGDDEAAAFQLRVELKVIFLDAAGFVFGVRPDKALGVLFSGRAMDYDDDDQRRCAESESMAVSHHGFVILLREMREMCHGSNQKYI